MITHGITGTSVKCMEGSLCMTWSPKYIITQYSMCTLGWHTSRMKHHTNSRMFMYFMQRLTKEDMNIVLNLSWFLKGFLFCIYSVVMWSLWPVGWRLWLLTEMMVICAHPWPTSSFITSWRFFHDLLFSLNHWMRVICSTTLTCCFLSLSPTSLGWWFCCPGQDRIRAAVYPSKV